MHRPERLATARRLELTGAAEAGDRVEGLFRGVRVSLEDQGLERTLRFDVDRPVKWVTVGPRAKELNDPDVVTTGEADFDDAITVLAEDGAEPAVRGVFATPALRQAVREFFCKFPLAELKGKTLSLPHLPADNHQTSAALEQGARLTLDLRAAIDLAPIVPLEPPPVLLRTASERPKVEPPDSRDRLAPPTDTDGVFQVVAVLVAGVAWLFFREHFLPVVIVGGLGVAGLYWLSKQAPRS